MKRLFAAVGAIAALTAGSALAQETMTGQQDSLAVIEEQVQAEFARLGVTEIDVGSLTYDQVAEIYAMLSTEAGTSDDQLREHIEQIANQDVAN